MARKTLNMLKKYTLHYGIAFKYLKTILENGNTLSVEILKLNDFRLGNFFVLLPSIAAASKLYDFDSGGILPQIHRNDDDQVESNSTWSEIPTIQLEICDFFFNFLKEKEIFTLIFEESLDSPKSPHIIPLQKKGIVRIFNNEVYYLLNKNDFNMISECLEKSNAIWRSLSVLSNFDSRGSISSVISRDDLIGICSDIELIMIGAYDGEAYVFWERNVIDS